MSNQDKYAIIESGSKQYRVSAGDVIDVELLEGVSDENQAVSFDKILLFKDGETTEVGAPVLEKRSVKGEFVEESFGKKVIAYKYKRRQNYHRKVGHRQRYSRVKITEVA